MEYFAEMGAEAWVGAAAICVSIIVTGMLNWSSIKKHLIIIETKLGMHMEQNHREHQEIKDKLVVNDTEHSALHGRVSEQGERVSKLEGSCNGE